MVWYHVSFFLAETAYCLTETITKTLLAMQCWTSHQREMLRLTYVKLMQLM